MQTKITIRNEAQTCYIDIEGTIGVAEKNQFEPSSQSIATFEAFRREVARIAEVAAARVVVNIRSTGGDVNDALLIYDALQGLDAKITTRCYGYTASAATIIAQAADKGCREISSNALYLIHNSMCAIEGNAASLESRAELLRKTDERLAHLYAQHADKQAEYFAELMSENNGEGRWLTAEETLQAGLADKIIDNLIVGSLIPDQSDATTPSQGEVTASVEETLPVAHTKACDKSDVKQALNRAAGTVLGYLLNRFSYRWEQWIENIRRKREEHLEERQQKRLEESQAQEQSARQQSANQPSATEQTAAAPSAETPSPTDNLPQAAAKSSLSERSAILFEEGQRRYSPTRVKPTEDPSMNRPQAGANQSAYDEDAKAFGRY